jgi:hypothetical protein
MHANHVAFLEWAAGYDDGGLDMRSLARHEAWLDALPCPVKRIEGETTLSEALTRAETAVIARSELS